MLALMTLNQLPPFGIMCKAHDFNSLELISSEIICEHTLRLHSTRTIFYSLVQSPWSGSNTIY